MESKVQESIYASSHGVLAQGKDNDCNGSIKHNTGTTFCCKEQEGKIINIYNVTIGHVHPGASIQIGLQKKENRRKSI